MAITKIKDISSKEILDRSVAPVSGKPKDIRFPEYFETVTDNGITVLVINDSRLPLVTTRFVFKSGAVCDNYFYKNKSGLSYLTAELLTKGTKIKSATEIAEEVDFIGATLSAGCDYDATYISTYSLKKYLNTIFEIASDVILNPTFEENEIERLSEQRINSLLLTKDEGDYLAEKTFKKVVHLDTPYAFPVEGEIDTIKDIVKQDIVNYYGKVFAPENLIVTFVGDITPDEAMLKIQESFSKWETKKVDEIILKKPKINDSVKVYITEKKGAVQSSLKLGHTGFSRNSPDYIPATVMNTLLGGYFTSRINKNLREVNGYTYGARSYFSCYKQSGDFSVVTEVKNEITSLTVKEILKELNDIRNNFVTEEELQNVKNYISGNFPLQLETPNAIASKVINLKLNNLEKDFYNTYIKKINELTVDDIKAAAEKYIKPDKLTISIAGNPDEIKNELSQFGEVEIIQDKV